MAAQLQVLGLNRFADKLMAPFDTLEPAARPLENFVFEPPQPLCGLIVPIVGVLGYGTFCL
jgi:hypothetical protein